MSSALAEPPVEERDQPPDRASFDDPGEGFNGDQPTDGFDGGDDHSVDDDDDSRRWITIASYNSAVEAHLARLTLERHEIDVLLLDEASADTMLFCLASKGVRLQVPAIDATRARDVLAEVRRTASGERPGEQDTSHWSTIAALRSELEAAIVASVLDQHELDCELRRDAPWGMLGPATMTHIRVDPADVEAAQKVLEATPARQWLIDPTAGPFEPRLRVNWPGVLFAVGIVLLLLLGGYPSLAIGASLITLMGLRWLLTYDSAYQRRRY